MCNKFGGRGDWIRTSDLLNPIQVRYNRGVNIPNHGPAYLAALAALAVLIIAVLTLALMQTLEVPR